jgi:F-type H+-transporting ATPase subunit alpha
LSDEKGGGSLTALPFIETQAGDVSAYIPTNVISITDGQIYLEGDLFNSNVRPAINVGLSVSRVGGSAQIKAMRSVAGTLRLDLAQYRNLEAFAQFGSDLDKASQDQLSRGKRWVEVLKQGPYSPIPVEKQVAIIFAGNNGFLDDIAVEDVRRFEAELYQFLDNNKSDVLQAIREKKQIDDDLKGKLTSALKEFKARFGAKRVEKTADKAEDKNKPGNQNGATANPAAPPATTNQAAGSNGAVQPEGAKEAAQPEQSKV